MNSHCQTIARMAHIYWQKIKTNQAINIFLGRENIDVNELVTNSVAANFSTDKVIVFSVPIDAANEKGMIQWIKATRDKHTEIVALIFDTRNGTKHYSFILDKKKGIRYQTNAISIDDVSEYAGNMNYTLNVLNRMLKQANRSQFAA